MSTSTIGVIGAGVMGSGIAQVAAGKGLNVILLYVNDTEVRKGIDGVRERLAHLASKGKVTASEKEAALQHIKGTIAYDDLKPADIVIEAVNENFDLKTKILKQLTEYSTPMRLLRPTPLPCR